MTEARDAGIGRSVPRRVPGTAIAPHDTLMERELVADDAAPLLFVVDDDEATLQLVRDVAADAGWNARGFTRLHDLRAALHRRRPTLIILDDDLPDGRGGDLARELGSDPRTTHLPLLVCTAAPPMRQAEIGRWAPVISKPFDLDDIERYFAAAAARTFRRGDLPRRVAR